jgi:probable HAF family extracellular repeat protein
LCGLALALVVTPVAVGSAVSLGVPQAARVEAAQGGWAIRNLSDLGGEESVSLSTGINERGQVVGGRYTSDGGWQAFVWQKGTLTVLDTPGWEESRAVGINERGQILGEGETSGSGRRAVLWQRGKMVDLGALPGETATEATAINDRGQIVGESYGAGRWHAFLWQKGKMTDLGTLGGAESFASVASYSRGWLSQGAINNRGQIVGFSNTASGTWHAFLWQQGKMTDLGALGGATSFAAAINERGQIVGGSEISKARGHAFLWQQGRMTDLGTLGGKRSSAVAINERG